MKPSILPLIITLTFPTTLFAASEQDVDYVKKQINQASVRLETARQQHKAALAEADKFKSAAGRAEEEIKALRKLLDLYTEEEQQQRVEKPDETVNTVRTSIMRQLQDSWRIPSTAKNGMSAKVTIELSRDGRVNQAWIDKSSGDAAFDNTAVQSVYRVNQFDEIQGISDSTYERHFRKLTISFGPLAGLGR